MEIHQPFLRGGCSCGRNTYAISIPDGATNEAEVIFSGNQDHHETNATIRRTFTPLHAPHTQRNFCGYCGTPLTFWTEKPESEAEFMSVALGSLLGDDLSLLEDLQILPPDEESSEEIATETVPTNLATRTTAPTSSSSSSRISYHSGTLAGVPWFEEMIEGSRLGRIMRSRRGIGVSDDDLTTFEWEISEWQDTDTGRQPTRIFTSGAGGSGKRKAEDVIIS
uniref:CENP-V/GFA domain-containing protein n=1 Tax=Talaromyces marneffei PM1 TaxID=1077442 RepID=A0A093UPQ7_TALMA